MNEPVVQAALNAGWTIWTLTEDEDGEAQIAVQHGSQGG